MCPAHSDLKYFRIRRNSAAAARAQAREIMKRTPLNLAIRIPDLDADVGNQDASALSAIERLPWLNSPGAPGDSLPDFAIQFEELEDPFLPASRAPALLLPLMLALHAQGAAGGGALGPGAAADPTSMQRLTPAAAASNSAYACAAIRPSSAAPRREFEGPAHAAAAANALAQPASGAGSASSLYHGWGWEWGRGLHDPPQASSSCCVLLRKPTPAPRPLECPRHSCFLLLPLSQIP